MLKTEPRRRHYDAGGNDDDPLRSRRRCSRESKSTEKSVKDQLRQAEILFLKGDGNYQKALNIANEILQLEMTNKEREEEGDGIRLSTPLHIPDSDYSHFKDPLTFQVSLDNHTSFADEAAAIVLQSIFELGRGQRNTQGRDDNDDSNSNSDTERDLMPFFDYYRQHNMSLELFVIFLRFWDAWPCYGGTQRNTAQAILWSVECLKKAVASTSSDPTELQHHYDEILLNLITRFLLRMKDGVVASSILRATLHPVMMNDLTACPSLPTLDKITLSTRSSQKDRQQNAVIETLLTILQEISSTSDPSRHHRYDFTAAISKSQRTLQRKITELERGEIPIASPLKKRQEQSKSEQDKCLLDEESSVVTSARNNTLADDSSSRRYPMPLSSLPDSFQRYDFVQKWASKIEYLTKLSSEVETSSTAGIIVAMGSMSIAALLLKWRQRRVGRGALSVGTLFLLRKPIQHLVQTMIKASKGSN